MTRKTPLAFTVGTSLFGGSSSLIMLPIQNKLSGGERRKLTLHDAIENVALNACESALITSPLGMLMHLKRMNDSYGQICIIGASTGVTFNFIESRFGQQQQQQKNHSASFAAMMGIIGGLSTHISNLFCQHISNEIFRALNRIGLEMIIVMLIDCAIEIYHQMQKESHLFWGNFLSQFAVILVSECAQNLTRRTNCYNRLINLDLIRANMRKDDIKNPKTFEAQLLDIHAQINKLPLNVIAENLERVKMYNNFHLKLSQLKFHRKQQQQNSLISDNNPGGQTQKLEQFFNLPKKPNEIKRLEKLMKPRLMGPNNMHFLIGTRSGQIAVDLIPRVNGKRGAERVIFEEYYGKYIYTDHTLHHNYNGCRISSRNFIIDPSQFIFRFEHFNRIFLKNYELKN